MLVRLRPRALARVDHEQEQVDPARAGDHRADEALVARARRRPRAASRPAARAARSRGRSRSRARAPRAAGRCSCRSAPRRASSCRGRCDPRCRPSAACVHANRRRVDGVTRLLTWITVAILLAAAVYFLVLAVGPTGIGPLPGDGPPGETVARRRVARREPRRRGARTRRRRDGRPSLAPCTCSRPRRPCPRSRPSTTSTRTTRRTCAATPTTRTTAATVDVVRCGDRGRGRLACAPPPPARGGAHAVLTAAHARHRRGGREGPLASGRARGRPPRRRARPRRR